MKKSNPQFELDDAIIFLIGVPIKGFPNNLSLTINGVTRLEKLIFLIEKDTVLGNLIKESGAFEPSKFGPFSSKVYQTLDILVSAGLIEDNRMLAPDEMDTWEERNIIGFEPDPFTVRHFKLTKRGEEYYNVLAKDIGKNTLLQMASFKNQLAYLPMGTIVRYTYLQYPKFTLVAPLTPLIAQ